VAASERRTPPGFEDGYFYANGWHISGEMGGVWAPPLKLLDGTPSQTPNRKSEIEGPLYLARSTYRPQVQPATLDPELIARTEDRYAGIRVGAVQELAHLLTSRDPAVVLAAREALSRTKR
jgi:hypothetical protein